MSGETAGAVSRPPEPGSSEAADDTAVEVFERHRRLLFGVAYRILGSVTEAEDVVQETWLRWDRADRAAVTDPRAYLARIASRAALDQLRRASAARETYVGPWLPEPLVTGSDPTRAVGTAAEVVAGPDDVADHAVLAESVSMAMLVVLESLSPLERVVFVLKDVFGFSYPEIATMLERSEAAVRQLGHRARSHVQARRPRFPADRTAQAAVTTRFLAAATGGDLAELLAVLAPEVTLVADGGGKARAARRPIVGAEKVARFLLGANRNAPAGAVFHLTEVNGAPALIATLEESPLLLLTLDVDARDDRITAIHLIANPDKLPQEL